MPMLVTTLTRLIQTVQDMLVKYLEPNWLFIPLFMDVFSSSSAVVELSRFITDSWHTERRKQAGILVFESWLVSTDQIPSKDFSVYMTSPLLHFHDQHLWILLEEQDHD
jgi:hypothetical protein